MDMNQYMTMFLEEAREHLQTLNSSLLDLENDPSNISVLDEIFRSAHTIKGMSATMGFTVMAELTHEMENVLDLLRKGTIPATHEILDILFQCVDTLEQLVDNVSVGDAESVDITELVKTLKALASGKPIAAPAAPVVSAPAATAQVNQKDTMSLNDTDMAVVQAAQQQGMTSYDIRIGLREGCVLKSARVYMVMTVLDDLGEVIKTVPPAEELEQEKFDLQFELLLVSDHDMEEIRQRLMNISEVDQVEIAPCQENEKNEPLSAAVSAVAEQSTVGQKAAAPAAKQADHPAAGAKQLKGGQSVRVDIDKLDSLLNLVGELVINKTRLEQIGITHRLTDLVETIEQMDRVTTDLQSVVMKVRMVPVGQVFNRFPRMVRDLARELNKEINLVIEGEETELDRTVIDEIGDPLVHLLRNSIDHGVEHADVRKAQGKNPVGEVRLIARHEGNNVIIEVEDDGKGIDPEVIKRKAVEKGMITAQEAEKMDAAEAVRLVFLPGFSTAEVLTDVSGRGVGMDVVKTKIESLGGMVDVETKLGVGSKFKIRLPLTLAIIQALLVKVSDETYAIPLGSIDSTINLQAGDIKTVQNKEVILLRGQIIPIVRLANVLKVTAQSMEAMDELFVVIVHVGDQKAGIIVDTLIGQQEIVIKSLGKLLAGIKSIAGATILGNGQVALILDVGSLMQ